MKYFNCIFLLFLNVQLVTLAQDEPSEQDFDYLINVDFTTNHHGEILWEVPKDENIPSEFYLTDRVGFKVTMRNKGDLGTLPHLAIGFAPRGKENIAGALRPILIPPPPPPPGNDDRTAEVITNYTVIPPNILHFAQTGQVRLQVQLGYSFSGSDIDMQLLNNGAFVIEKELRIKISESSISSIRFYPIPFQKTLFIEGIPFTRKRPVLVIFDQNGVFLEKVVLKRSAFLKRYYYSGGHLKPGTYITHLHTGGKKVIKKIVKK